MNQDYCQYDYVIQMEKRIGQGQFGIVVECYHKSKHKNIKLCAKIVQNNTNIDESMMKEIQILKKIKSINNSHLIKVYDVFEAENKFFIIMERCQGGELKHIIEKKKTDKQQLKTSEILDFIYQFIDGYQILYNNNIMHRDIKPQNIFVDQDQYKIGDLGAGRILEDVKIKGDYTKIGSPIYSSPQILSLKPFSSQTDVYSLGMVLYQLTFLDFPFRPALAELNKFISSLQKQSFSLNQPIRNEGTEREKDEIRFLIENMLVYEENQRISWEKLFERLHTEVVYEQLRQKYENQILMNTVIDWDKKNQKKQAKEAKELQEATQIYQYQGGSNIKLNNMIPSTNQERKRSPLSQYLRLQSCKLLIVDSAMTYLREVISSTLIPISLFEYLLILCSMYGYQCNLLKNIDAIHKGDYNSLSEHLREQKENEYQNMQTLKEFQQLKTEDDYRIYEQCTNQLLRIQTLSTQTATQTISKINEQKIKFQTLCEMREVLYKFSTYINYYKYWEFIRKFFNSSLQRMFNEYLFQDLSKMQDQLLFFIVFMYELCSLEEKHKQLEFFKENKIMIVPKQSYTREEAINYLENKRNQLQNQQYNQNQFY